jgi:hypothetical protein
MKFNLNHFRNYLTSFGSSGKKGKDESLTKFKEALDSLEEKFNPANKSEEKK